MISSGSASLFFCISVQVIRTAFWDGDPSEPVVYVFRPRPDLNRDFWVWTIECVHQSALMMLTIILGRHWSRSAAVLAMHR